MCKKKKNKKRTIYKENRNAKTYPLNLWFILSKYIKPEDVGRFAGICKGTNQVVNTASFWFNLYKRFYRPNDSVPQNLRPEYMTHLYQLRFNVIRALHYTYPPFIKRYNFKNYSKTVLRYLPSSALNRHKSVLEKTVCNSFWTEPFAEKFSITFLLQHKDSKAISIENVSKSQQLAMRNDFLVNYLDGFISMKVFCSLTPQFPNVYGLRLMSIKYENNNLELEFSTSKITKYNECIFRLRDVKEIHVHNWWSPHYPRNTSTWGKITA